jgi:hypothetical protein
VTAAFIVQLLIVAWNPLQQLPTRADRQAGQRLERWIRAQTVPVHVPAHPYLVARVTGERQVHQMALRDVVSGPAGSLEAGLWSAYRDALSHHRWPLIVLDTEDWMAREVERAGYVRVFSTMLREREFWTLTGARTRPEWIYAAPGVDLQRLRPPGDF